MAIKIPPSSRTQEALDTPFEPMRNPGFNGLPQTFVSTDVQNAIEEALNKAISNDNFLLLGSHNGNANTGRYLSWFQSIDSSAAPFFQPVASRILSVVAQTTATAATCTIGLFDLNVSSTVPVYTITFSSQKRVSVAGTPLATLLANSQLAARVTSGSISQPTLYIFLAQ